MSELRDDAYTFERLAVRHARGLDRSGIELDDLSPAINVVFGPNASGKTTLARAIQTLLWPERPALPDAEISASLRRGDHRWEITYHRGRRDISYDGRGADDLELPNPRTRDRYYLGLHELLETRAEDLADIVARESAGGYDVDAARDTLGYSVGSLRRNKSTRRVEEARQQWEEARRKQRQLIDQQRRLEDLRRRRAQLREDRRRIELLGDLFDYRRAAAERDDAARRLDALPDALARISGDELADFDDLTGQIEDADGEFDAATRDIERYRQKLTDSPLPDDGFDDGLLARLDEYAEQLDEIERERQSLRQTVADATTRRDRALRRLGGDVDTDEFSDIDADAIDELTRLGADLAEVQGEDRTFELLGDILDDGDDHGDQPDVDELRDGIELLRRWLGEPSTPQQTDRNPSRLIIGAVVGGLLAIAASGIGLTVFLHPTWLLLLVAVGCVAWAFWRLRPKASNDESTSRRAVYRRDFRDLDLAEPTSWSPDAVERHLAKLVEQRASAEIERQKSAQWDHLGIERRQLAERRRQLDEHRSRLAERLRIDIDGDPSRIAWRISNIDRWQEADDEVRGAQQRLDKVEQTRRQLLDKFNRTVDALGYETIDDRAQLRARLQQIEDDAGEWTSLRQALGDARRRRDEAKRRRDDGRRRLDTLLDRLELDEADRGTIADLCARKPDYEERRDDYVGARETARQLRGKLDGHDDFDESLLDEELEVLRDRHRQLTRDVDDLDDIRDETSRIEADIDAAKKSAEVETKHREYEAGLEQLRRRRTEDYRRAIGATLADHVHRKTRDSSRPDVFHRARQLLLEITRGRYRLELGESDGETRFRAYDTTRQRGFAIDELSSGTRVQLLLALRVAFVDGQEPGPTVPLVLDEALANSDDDRARAIVEAIEQIGATGRQIFYFTAQRDEVRKWRQWFDRDDVDGRLIELGTETTPAGDELGEEVVAPAVDPVPAPDAMSHESYGKALGIEGALRPQRPVTDVHLWYLVEQPDRLHDLLRHGITRWGQLREIADHDGLGSVAMTDGEYAKIKARADVVDAVLDARSIGRGKTVDRRALEDSGAVSDTFIDRVHELCQQVDGDAGLLVDGLDDGAVKRFRHDKTRELETYLDDEGYLDDAQPLQSDEIFHRALAAAAPAIRRDISDQLDVRRLLARISDTAVEAREPDPA